MDMLVAYGVGLAWQHLYCTDHEPQVCATLSSLDKAWTVLCLDLMGMVLFRTDQLHHENLHVVHVS